jgi:quercetin dioxygenase-like cupin family protein
MPFGNILQHFRSDFTTLGARPAQIAQAANTSGARDQGETRMSAKAIIQMPGEGKEFTVAGKPMLVLVTAADSRHACMFDWTLPAKFSTGLHVHRVQEETFYVLEGECDWQVGDQRVRARPGAFLFVPPGVPHDIGNATDRPARMLMTVSPPGHEHYFEELAKLAARGDRPDANAIAELRGRYDTVQLSALKTSGQ